METVFRKIAPEPSSCWCRSGLCSRRSPLPRFVWLYRVDRTTEEKGLTIHLEHGAHVRTFAANLVCQVTLAAPQQHGVEFLHTLRPRDGNTEVPAAKAHQILHKPLLVAR